MKELQNVNGERDSSLRAVIKERGEDPAAAGLPSKLHPEQQEKKRRRGEGQVRSVWFDTLRDTRTDTSMPLWGGAAIGGQAASPV